MKIMCSHISSNHLFFYTKEGRIDSTLFSIFHTHTHAMEIIIFNFFTTFTRRIILFLFLSCVIMLATNTVAAESWKKKDIIHSSVVCLNEETILEVARHDSESLEGTVSFIRRMIIEGRCVSFMQPVEFQVDDTILNYTDYSKNQSAVLRLNHPYSDNNPFGFVIALHKPSV